LILDVLQQTLMRCIDFPMATFEKSADVSRS